MVDGGSKDLALIRSSAFDLHLIEQLLPDFLGFFALPVEVPARNLSVQVIQGVGFAYIGDSHLHLNFAVLAEIKPRSGAFALGRSLAVVDGVFLPGAELLEGMLECSRKIQRVARSRRAESARGYCTAQAVVADHFHLAAILLTPPSRPKQR